VSKAKRNRERHRQEAEAAAAKARPRASALDALNPDEPCLCGSGRPFGECCSIVLQDTSSDVKNVWKRATEPLQKGDFAQAETFYRAHFVEYVVWVRQHTVPVLTVEQQFAKALVITDLDALEVICDRVCMCLARQQMPGAIQAFLQNAEKVVPLPQFRERAVYLRALWKYLAEDDASAARHELAQIDVARCQHRETLELYIDVFRRILSPREKLELAGRVVELAKANRTLKAERRDKTIVLQYTCVQASSLVLLGEKVRATALLKAVTEGIAPFKQPRSPEEVDESVHLAHALALRAGLEQNSETGGVAERIIRSIPREQFTSTGKAMLEMDLGRLLMQRGAFGDAAAAFALADALSPDIVSKIKLGHAAALAGKLENANVALSAIDVATLPGGLQLEYMEALADFVMAANDRVRARNVVADLKRLKEDEPYFAEHRNQVIITLQDFISSSSVTAPPPPRGIAGVLSWINQYSELKPNVFGLGINLNAVLDRIIRRLSAIE
jgi:hypothetical protein